MQIKKVFIIILFCSFTNLFAKESKETKEAKESKKKSWYVPDYASLQFAGNIGYISVGVGYELFDDIWYGEILYGYVPESISKAESIHLITLKNTFPIFTKEIGKNLTISPIAGLGITYDVGSDTFTTLPSRFPKEYYISNAIHFTIFGGIKIHKDFTNVKLFQGMDFYAELGTVESYLWYAITSSEVSFSDAFSTAIGVKFYF